MATLAVLSFALGAPLFAYIIGGLTWNFIDWKWEVLLLNELSEGARFVLIALFWLFLVVGIVGINSSSEKEKQSNK